MAHPGGRPTKMTEATLQKLEYAFSLGCPDKEACLYAGISPTTLYNYQEDHPEFVERKEQLKDNIIILARQTILEKVTDSYNNSMDYLKRKRREEFGDNVDLTTDGQKIQFSLVQEVAEKYATNGSAETDSAKQETV